MSIIANNAVENQAVGTHDVRASSWRAKLPIHPAADRIPDSTPEEKRTLSGDLERNGQRVPVVLIRIATDPDPRPKLLDGRIRLDLLEAAGVQIIDSGGRLLVPYRIEHVQDDAEAERLSLSLNFHRRHLTPEQKRARIVELLRADPGQSDRRIASTIQASPTFVGKVRAEKEATGDVSTVDTRVDTTGRRQPANKTKAVVKAESRGSQPPKFTPERIWQIHNLVERGKTREEIAEIVGVTPGALQVACSKNGVSLRRLSAPTAVVPVSTATVPVTVPAAATPAIVPAAEPAATVPTTCDGVSKNTSETERLRARVGELEHEIHCLKSQLTGCESQLEELRAAKCLTLDDVLGWWRGLQPDERQQFFDNTEMTEVLAAIPIRWRPVLEERCASHLSASQLLNHLQHRLDRDGIDAFTHLRKIRDLIEQSPSLAQLN